MKDATADEILDFITRARTERNHVIRNEAIAALSHTQSPEAAAALAGLLGDISTRRNAGVALQNMGPIGAPAVVQQLYGDVFTQLEALKVLDAIGTTKELPVMRGMSGSLHVSAKRKFARPSPPSRCGARWDPEGQTENVFQQIGNNNKYENEKTWNPIGLPWWTPQPSSE